MSRKAGKGKTWYALGIDDLDARLKQLPATLARKVIVQSIRAAMYPVQQAVKQGAPEDTGKLRKSVRVRVMKKTKDRIGLNVIIGKGDFLGETYYAAMVEFGHKLGSRKLQDRKQVPGQHYMQLAFLLTKGKALDEALRRIRDGLDTVITDLSRV